MGIEVITNQNYLLSIWMINIEKFFDLLTHQVQHCADAVQDKIGIGGIVDIGFHNVTVYPHSFNRLGVQLAYVPHQ